MSWVGVDGAELRWMELGGAGARKNEILMNTSTSKEKILDTDSRFPSPAIDERIVTDNRCQRKRKKIAKNSIAKTSIGKNASLDFQELYRDL